MRERRAPVMLAETVRCSAEAPALDAREDGPMADKDKKKKLSRGEDVTWKSHGQEVDGTVTRKVTKRTKAAGRTVDASKDEPQYEVESDKTGRAAVHKPESLRKKDGGS
jgi:hypothetical protein